VNKMCSKTNQIFFQYVVAFIHCCFVQLQCLTYAPQTDKCKAKHTIPDIHASLSNHMVFGYEFRNFV